MNYMRGSIRKRGKTFQYRFHIRDPITNERKELSKGGFEKEKDAERAMILAMAEYEKGTLDLSGKFSFKQLSELWLEEKQGNVRESTMYSYKRALNARIMPEFERLDIKDIKPMHIHNFYQKLKKEGLSKRYISYVGTIIGSVFKKAVTLELIYKNPVENVDKPKMNKNKMKSWTADQAIEFLQVAKVRSVYYLAYFLAFNTGMRIGEVLGLHWSDIDFDAKMIHVQHTLTMVEGDYIIGPVKTESSDRHIPMSDNLIYEFEEHKKFSKNTSEDLVFRTKKGKLVDPYILRYMMKAICTELELPYIRFHDIRRTHTSILIDEGVSPKVVSQRLGHSDVSITLNIYTDVFDERQVDATDKMDQILSRGQLVVKSQKQDDTNH
ncbi:tyrosine-type recombinase/integrase [Cytobacillus praedii]|uniref:tyrosine-type recombinase/integrase n=1 Tax=Cytobacillus praedii TaxID=1742358 RepID=UPI002E1C5D91|nr:tyrosine-type recombinase/integrase [Cytobacillus praedii]MED3575781.1 tyrosine-type recombinase/integrase [Cytobacillus praedii]